MGCGASSSAQPVSLLDGHHPHKHNNGKHFPHAYHVAPSSTQPVISNPNAVSTFFSGRHMASGSGSGSGPTSSAQDSSECNSFIPQLRPPFRTAFHTHSPASASTHLQSKSQAQCSPLINPHFLVPSRQTNGVIVESGAKHFPEVLAISKSIAASQKQLGDESVGQLSQPVKSAESSAPLAGPESTAVATLLRSSGASNIASYRLQRSQTRQKVVDIDLIQFDSLDSPRRSSPSLGLNRESSDSASGSTSSYSSIPTELPGQSRLRLRLAKSNSISESHSAALSRSESQSQSDSQSQSQSQSGLISAASAANAQSMNPLTLRRLPISPSPLNSARGELDSFRSSGPGPIRIAHSNQTNTAAPPSTAVPPNGSSPVLASASASFHSLSTFSSFSGSSSTASRSTSLIIGHAIPSRLLAANLFRSGLKCEIVEPGPDVLDTFKNRQSMLNGQYLTPTASSLSLRPNFYQSIFVELESDDNADSICDWIHRLRALEHENQLESTIIIGLIPRSILDSMDKSPSQRSIMLTLCANAGFDALFDRGAPLNTLYTRFRSSFKPLLRVQTLWLLNHDNEIIEFDRSNGLIRRVPNIPQLNLSNTNVNVNVNGMELPISAAAASSNKKSNRFKTSTTARQLTQRSVSNASGTSARAPVHKLISQSQSHILPSSTLSSSSRLQITLSSPPQAESCLSSHPDTLLAASTHNVAPVPNHSVAPDATQVPIPALSDAISASASSCPAADTDSTQSSSASTPERASVS